MNQILIRKACNGDLEAFTGIVNEYKGFLMSVVLSIVRDAIIAEDILQEAFIQIHRSLPHYRGGSFKHWLARIATNKAIDWKRKEKRRCLETPLSDIENEQDVSVTTEGEVFKKETYSRLQAIFKQLPLEYKRTFESFYLKGKSYQKIANEEGVTVKTVESRLYRARKIIREKWKEEQG